MKMQPKYHLRARLTREGWYYLAVLTFIVGGAALCHVNLLVVLGGMMLAPLLINWRLALAGLRGVTIRRLPVRAVHAGQPLIVEFEITNRRRWMAAWLLTVEDRWQLEQSPGLPPAGSIFQFRNLLQYALSGTGYVAATAFAPCVGPGETTRINYELVVSRRGRYSLSAIRLRTCFPLGLIEAEATITSPREVLILPRIGRLSAEWTHRIAAAMAGEGERQLRQRASDGEFFAIRPWQSGDSTHWIHWRTTARAGRPMVRQFEREASPTVALILDPYLPADPTAGERARCEAAISFIATALADLAQRDVARLAVLVASAEKPYWIGGRSPVFLDEVLAQLASLPSQAADHRAGLDEILAEHLAGAACVIVVSSRPGSGSPQHDAGQKDGDSAFASSLADQHTICVASPEFATLYSVE